MGKQSIAVVGNPNSGKSTLFNGLTGSTQHIGNWPGVTVEKKTGILLGTTDVEIVDLPGIYSLNADSEDEIIARKHVRSGDTDLVVNIADASNLERNLFLTIALLEMGRPTFLVLSKMDVAKKNGMTIDVEALSQALGIPVIAINALKEADLRKVREAISNWLTTLKSAESRVRYSESIESVIAEWEPKLGEHPRQTALLLLEEDEETTSVVVGTGALTVDEIQTQIEIVDAACGDPPDAVIAETRFRYIAALLKGVIEKSGAVDGITEKIDKVILNKWTGIPIFLGVIYLLFWTVIHIGGSFIDFFDILFGAIFVDGFGIALEFFGLPEWLVMLLAGGVGAGIQTVSTFVPIIFFMFLMLSLLEDSGYMARAAFVMDRFMQKIGLPGKAFVPMLVGFGCTVPAVLATRTLENRRDRYLTVFMAPFMSCGARLPVYALFGAAFFGARSGLMIFAIYLSGFFLAVLTGLILKNTLFRGTSSPFVMEIPPYHLPRFGTIMGRTWNRLRLFLFRAGKVIVVAVLLLAFLNSLGVDGSFGNEGKKNSVLAAAGETLTPVFKPMGIEQENWPAIVGLVTGLFAKEAIVGTIAGLYGQMAVVGVAAEGEGEEETFSLS